MGKMTVIHPNGYFIPCGIHKITDVLQAQAHEQRDNSRVWYLTSVFDTDPDATVLRYREEDLIKIIEEGVYRHRKTLPLRIRFEMWRARDELDLVDKNPPPQLVNDPSPKKAVIRPIKLPPKSGFWE